MSNEKPIENKSNRNPEPTVITFWWLIIAILVGAIGTLIVLSIISDNENLQSDMPYEVMYGEDFNLAVRVSLARGVFAVGGEEYFYHENGSYLREGVWVPFGWTGEQPMRFDGFWAEGVQYFDADGQRVYPNPESMIFPEGFTLTARWIAVVEPHENKPSDEVSLNHELTYPPVQKPEQTPVATSISDLFFEGNTMVTTERGTNAAMRVDVDAVSLGGVAHPKSIVFESNHDGMGGFSFTLVHFAHFNLGGNYNALTGDFGRTEGSVAHPAAVRFFGDDNSNHFYEFAFGQADFPVRLSLEVNGIRMLRMEVEYSRIVSATSLNRTSGLVAYAFVGQVE